MKRAAVVVMAVCAFAAVALFVACLWTAGLDLSTELGGTATIAATIAAVIAIEVYA